MFYICAIAKKKMKLLSFNNLLILAVFLTAAVCLEAMPPGPPTGPPTCFPPPCDPIPIDGGLSYILIAGVALGGKKIYDLNKK